MKTSLKTFRKLFKATFYFSENRKDLAQNRCMHVCKIFKLSENKKKKQNRKKFGIMLTFGNYSADNSQVGFD